jgi:hypothetical protein
LDNTLETIPANIAKLMHIDKTRFIPPPFPAVVNSAKTTFGIYYHDAREIGGSQHDSTWNLSYGVYEFCIR